MSYEAPGEVTVEPADVRRKQRIALAVVWSALFIDYSLMTVVIPIFPELNATEVDALSWIFKCLDEPHLAEPPPTDWGNPRAAAAVGGNARSAVGGAAKGGMSRQARRQAERDAKKRAKAGGGGGFAKKEVAKKKR